ncbi:MAG: hypothetical protein IV100_00585, partial [Myxococcales bacterium]|nr:hypothetical protein [Myxococcales bacterium]
MALTTASGSNLRTVFTTGLGGVCPAASSSFTCPTTSNAFKITTDDGVTVCINGWQSGDGGVAGSSVTRRLSVTSSDNSFRRGGSNF